MDYDVMRVCDGGRIVEKHVRQAGRTRGSLTIRQEADSVRHRAIIVARLAPAAGRRAIPPLFDATLVGTSGDCWMLRGYERIEAGPLAREVSVGQTWIVEPAAIQDLIDIETKWRSALLEASELREQLRALTGGRGSAGNKEPGQSQ